MSWSSARAWIVDSSCARIALSVSSSSSWPGESPASSRMRATDLGQEGCRSWCVETLTAIRIASKPSPCQLRTCAHALRSTHSPMLEDQARILGDRDELVRAHGSRLGLVPAQQRLGRAHRSAGRVADRLVVQRELLLLRARGATGWPGGACARPWRSSPRCRTGSCSRGGSWRGTSPCRRCAPASRGLRRPRDRPRCRCWPS